MLNSSSTHLLQCQTHWHDASTEVVTSTFGAMFIGLVLSSIFSGATLLQTYAYYDKYWCDSIFLRLFVAVIGILDVAHLMLVVHANWWYGVMHYGNPEALTQTPWSISVIASITAFVALLVQSFFALRAHILSKGNYAITGPILILSFCQFLFSTLVAALGHSQQTITVLRDNFWWASTVGISTNIAADILITTSLTFYLRRGRSATRRSDRLINILIMYTINTGVLTTCLAICTLIMLKLPVMRNTFWNSITYFVMTKAYVNSVLATLNSRQRLRQKAFGSIGLSDICFTTIAMSTTEKQHSLTIIDVSRPADEGAEEMATEQEGNAVMDSDIFMIIV